MKLQAAEKLLRKYAGEHAGKPTDKDADPMVAACMLAADTLKQITGDCLWVADVKMESVVSTHKYPAECFGQGDMPTRLKAMALYEREAAKMLVDDVLCSGLVRTSNRTDPMTGEVTVTAEMIVGVLGGEDVNEMLREKRDYEKYHG